MSPRRWLVSLVLLSLVSAACGEASPSASPAASAAASTAPSPAVSTAAGPPCPTTPDASAPAPRGWWQDRVFYETFVRSFSDSDGDGIGDLQGLISRLDYLNDGDPATTDDLGVTALWLMPIDESPSYHGYDVTDYRKVEPDYGTNDDFKALVAAARQRGIDVVVDFVPNHTSAESPWFQASQTPGSKYDDWYLWSATDPGVVSPDGRPVWYKDGDRYYYAYFWEGMPDLNLTNQAVTAELDSIARFWVEDMGAAGFRLDAARHLVEDGSELIDTPETHQWLQGFKGRLDAAHPDALLLGEVWDTTDVASSYVDDGSLDLTFEFDLAEKMAGAVYSGGSSLLRMSQTAVTGAYPAGGYATFLTNHDQDRIFDVLAHSTPRAKQAATLLLTNGGVPFLYYGEEIGLTGRKPDERIRTPMPWTGAGPGHGFTTGTPWEPLAEDVDTTTNVATQLADPDSLLAWYRSLIALRAAHPALRPGGTLSPLDTSSRKVYANLRYDPATGEMVVVASNLSGDPVKDVTLSLDRGPLCGTPTATVVLATTPTDIAAPAVSADGGFDGWTIGDLPANGDVIIALAH